MVGGAIISTTQLKVAASVYWNNVVQGLYIQDLWMGLIKPVVLGFVHRDDRLSRRPADDGRHAGRRAASTTTRSSWARSACWRWTSC